MIKSNRVPILILMLIIGGFFSWMKAFQSNEWLISLGVNTLQISVGTLSLYWLSQALRSAKGKEKIFWLLLSLGVGIYLSGNGIWFYLQIAEAAVLSEEISYLAWLFAYLCFLAALIAKIKGSSSSLSNNSNVFNIVVFMITATAISVHFLFTPVLALSGNSWLVTIPTLLYPIVDLTTLFIITLMYYLIQSGKEKEYMLFCVTGFFCQVTADLIYAYYAYNEAYFPGHFVDLLWLLALFFIGLTGFHAKDSNSPARMEVPNPLNNKDVIIPYSSILLMILLVIQSYQWDFNALSLGLLLIFLIVLGRQIQVHRKNSNLMGHLEHLAYHDTLTGLKNRRSFMREMKIFLKNPQINQAALLLIDLDRFKVVNDTLGHHIGDGILVKTAERLNTILPGQTSVYRIGGDEFVIVLADASEKLSADVATAVLKAFHPPILMEGHEINITPSIGISIFPDHGATSEELMKNADSAMYQSKEIGKNAFSFYNTELDKAMLRKMQIETELKKAIYSKQLSLFYQPKVELATRNIIGMEALLRWQHPELGSVSPVEFIPIAEETGQIIDIGEWVLHEACRQNKLWQEQGLPALCVSVNVSALQFQHDQFLQMVQNAIAESQLETRYIELEITESITQNIRESRMILESLREMGIRTSIDDFGTGYSSLSILQKLPIDTIKIDKSFVDELEKTGQYSMVKTIIDLSLNLNLNVVAEGIETDGQMKILQDNGCITGQGYLFSKPVASVEFEVLLQQMEKDDSYKQQLSLL